VENVLLRAVHVALRTQRLIVTEREVARETGGAARRGAVDGDRLHPVEDVLQHEPARDFPRDVPGKPRVGRRSAHVEEERAPVREDVPDRFPDVADPAEVLPSRPVVSVRGIADPEVVGRARDDHIGFRAAEPRRETRDRVLAVEPDRPARSAERDLLEERQGFASPAGRLSDG